jgi:hypothetical protein
LKHYEKCFEAEKHSRKAFSYLDWTLFLENCFRLIKVLSDALVHAVLPLTFVSFRLTLPLASCLLLGALLPNLSGFCTPMLFAPCSRSLFSAFTYLFSAISAIYTLPFALRQLSPSPYYLYSALSTLLYLFYRFTTLSSCCLHFTLFTLCLRCPLSHQASLSFRPCAPFFPLALLVIRL